jgi:hypothetical protein
MQDRVSKPLQPLQDTTQRGCSQVDIASEMELHLAELKLEYIAAGDKLHAKQNVIWELQVDLRNMESALNADRKREESADECAYLFLTGNRSGSRVSSASCQHMRGRAALQQDMIEGLQELV